MGRPRPPLRRCRGDARILVDRALNRLNRRSGRRRRSIALVGDIPNGEGGGDACVVSGDLEQLHMQLHLVLGRVRQRRDLVRTFFEGAGLEP